MQKSASNRVSHCQTIHEKSIIKSTKEEVVPSEIFVRQREDYPKTPRVVIECKEENQEVKDLVLLLKTKEKKLVGTLEGKEYIIKPRTVLYAESVDGATFLYTKKDVYRTTYTLTEIEGQLKTIGFFRCSKSTVLNINAIDSLTSQIGNRIDAKLVNEEHIVISRRYAKELRSILKGGMEE